MYDFLSHAWDIIWFIFTIFVFMAYLMVLFSIISDLFRDRALSGGAKAIWMIALVFLPFLTAIVYLIVRGKGMGERSVAQVAAQKEATDQYIRSVATSPSDEIQKAKVLLDNGIISQDEFASIKARVLA